jgi:hypothetical protein
VCKEVLKKDPLPTTDERKRRKRLRRRKLGQRVTPTLGNLLNEWDFLQDQPTISK